MTSAVVKRWIDWSATVTSDETQAIPLIDFIGGGWNFDEDLHEAWRDGDVELYAAFRSELGQNLPVRFATLNAYYHLMNYKRAEEENDFGGLERQRQKLREKLAGFIVHQPEEICTDLRTIRWEIVNACATEDYDRALRLCEQLSGLLPVWQVSFLTGQLHFLVAHLPFWDDPDAPALCRWDLSVGPPPSELEYIRTQPMGGNVASGVWSPELPVEISGKNKAYLRKAIAELGIASDENPDIPVECHLMLARSYAALGQYHDAAQSYGRVVAHRDALLPVGLTKVIAYPQNE